MPDTSDTSAIQATWMQHECDASIRVRHERDTSEKRASQVRHECYTNDTTATRVKILYTSKNIFSQPYIYYMASERLQGEEWFNFKNYLLEMPCFHAKICLKSALQKLNFLMAKTISKNCILDCSCKCPCTFPHSCAQ